MNMSPLKSPSLTRRIQCSILFLLCFQVLSAQDRPELRLQLGHGLLPNFVDFSEDESRFLALDMENTVKYWDIATAKEVHTFFKQTKPVFLKGTNSFLSIDANEPGLVKHWDLKNGQLIQSFTKGAGFFQQIIPLSTGTHFLTVHQDQSSTRIDLWDIKTGALNQSFQNNASPISELLLLPKEKSFLSAHQDGLIQHWDLEKGRLLNSFSSSSQGFPRLYLLPNQPSFLSLHPDGQVRYWNLKKSEALQTFKSTGGTQDLYVAPDGKSFFSSDKDRVLRQWDLSSAKLLQQFKGDAKGSRIQLRFLDDGKSFLMYYQGGAIAYDEYSIQHFRQKDAQEIHRYSGHSDEIVGLILVPESQAFLALSRDGSLKYWDLSTGKELYRRQASEKSNWIDFLVPSSSESFLVSDWFGRIQHLGIMGGNLIRDFRPSSSSIKDLEIFPNEESVLLANADASVKQWDISQGKISRSFMAHTDDVSDIVLLENTSSFVSGAWDGKINYWDLNGQLKRSYQAYQDEFDGVNALYMLPNQKNFFSLGPSLKYWSLDAQAPLQEFPFSPNQVIYLPKSQSFLASEYLGNHIYHYDLNSGKNILRYENPSLGDCRIQVLDSGQRLLAYAGIAEVDEENFAIKMIDFARGEEIQSFEGHQNFINSLLILPKQESFLSGSYDQSIKHWDIQTGKLIKSMEGHQGAILDLVLMPHQKTVLSASQDQSIKEWDIQTGKLVNSAQCQYAQPKKLFLLPNSNRALSLNAQNSVTLWDLDRFQEICTLTPKTGASQDFIIRTPDAYYMATQAGINDLVHYVVGGEIYLFDQFDLRYNRPDIVLERIGIASEVLIKAYRQAYIKRLKKSGFSEQKIQDFLDKSFEKEYTSPQIIRKKQGYFYQVEKPLFPLKFEARDPRYPLAQIQVFVNGVPIYGRKGLDLRSQKTQNSHQELDIVLGKGKNIIEISALNTQGLESLKDRFEVQYRPSKSSKPNLYLICIGASKYENSKMNLRYAQKDGQDLIQAFLSKKDQFSQIWIDSLFNENVQVDRILALKERLKNTSVDDLVIISYSGHGLLDQDLNYYLATYDCNFKEPSKSALPYERLESLLDGIPARNKLLLMDACHSGELDRENPRSSFQQDLPQGSVKGRGFPSEEDPKEGEIQDLEINLEPGTLGLPNSFELMKEIFTDLRRGTGATIISAAGGLEFALEGPNWQNGVFTYCLLQGLQKNKADLNGDGQVMISELKKYVQTRVPELTQGRQEPTSRIENLVNDFRVW